MTAAAACGLAAVLAALAPAAGAAGHAEPDGDRYAQPRLIAETATLPVGGTAHIALTFKLSPGWHLYWRNPGDSGMPPQVEWQLPEGVEIGAAQWPAPRRYPLPGDLLDYVHEERLTLIYPVSVAPTVAPGEKLPFHADIEWFICDEDVCVLGRGSAGAEFIAGAGAGRSVDAHFFDEARRRHAKPLKQSPGASARWEGATLVLSVPGATELQFFPYESERVLPVNPLRDGRARADVLRVEYRDAASDAELVRGVLEVRTGEAEARFLLVEVPGYGRRQEAERGE